MIRILASDGMEKGAIAALEQKGCEVVCEFFDPEALKTAVQSFDVLVVRSATKVRVPHIDAACQTGRLKLIIRGGVGVDNIDVAYAEEKGITVRNTPRASSDAVAELALGHMFSVARYISAAGQDGGTAEKEESPRRLLSVCSWWCCFRSLHLAVRPLRIILRRPIPFRLTQRLRSKMPTW